jgi:aminoglycoside phosphotransferase (APT) family kinase protein
MEPRHTPRWLDHFARAGHPRVEPLGAGMEAVVYRLGDGRIGKVWARRSAAEVTGLQQFYAELARGGLPFATPEIHEVRAVDGIVVSVERELPGTPLRQRVLDAGASTSEIAIACTAEVLQGLRRVPIAVSMERLRVLDEADPFWTGRWSGSLLGLMRRRVDRFGDQLRARVPGFDRLFAAVTERVASLPAAALAPLHGDLCPENLLVDEQCRVTAVIDFGFLSTVGDPAFDCAIAAGITDMYGPDARKLRQTLVEDLAGTLGYRAELLQLYLMVYAIVVSNAYDPLGRDGHFAWCVDLLNGEDLRGPVGM